MKKLWILSGVIIAWFFWVSVSYGGMVETNDGAIVYYKVTGKGDPILLVHGRTMSSKFWQKQIGPLAAHCMAVTMDLRTHGNSSKVTYGHTIPGTPKMFVRSLTPLTLKMSPL